MPNLQPALPVQAISPARISEVLIARPIASIAAIASATLSSRTPDISRFCQTVRRISPSPRSCAILARPRICSQVTLPSGSATPIQFRPSCFCWCTPICAMRSNAGRGASASGGTRVKAWPSFSSTSTRNFSMPMPSMTYFRRALSRLVRSPRSMKTRTMASDDLGGVRRLDDDAGILGEILVAGDAADPEPKPDAGLDTKTVFHLDRGKGDVVGVFEHRDLAGAVEGDVEFARQSRQRTVVEDVVVPFAGIFAGVEQFLRIDPGGRRARDVADVVGAGAARAQAEVLNALDQRHRILRRNFAHLQIGAGGDVGERPAQGLGEIGQPRKLPVLQDAVRNPQPAHVGILRRRDIEQAVIAPAEIVRRRRRRIDAAPAASAADRHRTDAPRA